MNAWQLEARDKLLQAVREHGPGTIDYLRTRIDIEPPHDLRAWGNVVRSLYNDSFISRHGYAPASSSHDSAKAIWRAA